MSATTTLVTLVVFDRLVTIESDSPLIKWESDITGKTTPVPNVPPIREGDWVVSPEDEAIVSAKEAFFKKVTWTNQLWFVLEGALIADTSPFYVWEGVHSEGIPIPQWCKRDWSPKKELFALAQKDGRVEQVMNARLRDWLASLPESQVCSTGLPKAYEPTPWVEQTLKDWGVKVPEGTIFGRGEEELVAVLPSGQKLFGQYLEDIADGIDNL